MKLNLVITIIVILLSIIGCKSTSPLLEPDIEELILSAPSEFTVRFNTSKGEILIDIKRENSPLAVDRFYYLAKNKYYDQNIFFRVLPKFVVQWGMKGIPEIDKIWEDKGIKDEPVKLSNSKGTISFARSGPNSRSNQLFINLENNSRLDTSELNGVKGFPAFGRVIKGMDVVEKINSSYLQLPNQDSIAAIGNKYLKKNFPDLDFIISSEIVSEK